MAGVRFLPAADRIARSWKNGGGETRDIAVFPAGAGDADFLWRVSLATIANASPFSPFPRVDRDCRLLRGELAIKIGDRAEQTVRPGDPALLFAGEEPVCARPVDGPCTALNVMVRRGRVSAKTGRWTVAEATVANALILFALERATVEAGRDRVVLAPDDALLLDRRSGLSAINGAVVAAGFFYEAG